MDEKKLELRLGVFVTVGLLVFCSIVLYFLKEGTIFDTYDVTAYFEDVTGVDSKSPVQMGGVKIGMVKRIEPPRAGAGAGKATSERPKDTDIASAEARGDYSHLTQQAKDARIKVILQIESKYDIRSRTVRIASKGLIGDKFLEFKLSDPQFTGESISSRSKAKDQQVEGETPTSQEELLKGVQKTLEFIGDPALKERVENFLDEATTLFRKGQPVLDDTDHLLKNVDSGVTTLTQDAHVMMGDISDQVTRTGDTLNRFMISFDPTREKVDRNLDELEKTLVSLRGMMDDARSGKGTIGKLFNDDALYDRLVSTADTVQVTLEDADVAVQYLTAHPSDLIWGRDEKKEPVERIESHPRPAYLIHGQ